MADELTLDKALMLLRGNSAFRLLYTHLVGEYEDKLLQLKDCPAERLDRLAGEISEARDTLDIISSNDIYGF